MRHIAFFWSICGKQAFCPCFVSFTQLRRISQNPKQITVRIKAILLRRFNQTVDHAAGLRLLLKSLIFRTGNGDHFFRLACLHFCVFHANIIPQSTAKSRCFQWFSPIFPAQTVGKWIQFKLLLDEPRQAVYALAQIRVATGDVDLICTSEIVQHRRRSATSSLSCSASQPG